MVFYRSSYVQRLLLRNKNKHLGRFEDIKDAEKAYIKASKEYFGEFYFDKNLNLEVSFE